MTIGETNVIRYSYLVSLPIINNIDINVPMDNGDYNVFEF